MKNIWRLRIIFIQALLAMLGSLYFSNFGDPIANIAAGNLLGGIGFNPCHLCRWARILMYPLVMISGIALIRRDSKAVYTILPFALIGVVLDTYHYTIQYINSLSVFGCVPGNPCTTIDWKMFGIITIPALAWIAFVLISVSCVIIIIRDKKNLQ